MLLPHHKAVNAIDINALGAYIHHAGNHARKVEKRTMNTQEKQITQLYTSYFDRAADSAGFDFWMNQINSGASLLGIAYSFSRSDEYQSIYGGLSNQALINTIYDNMFNRAPDVEGNAYWLAQLESGQTSGDLIVNIISGAQGNDLLTLENTAIVARDWTSTNAYQPFVMADAQNAVNSIGEVQGNGVNITFKSDALLPFAPQLTAAISAAWAQWGNHGMLDLELNFSDLQSNVLAFASARNEFLTGQTSNGWSLTQSNMGTEINTGRDMNGDMSDGYIYIAMNLEQFFQYDTTSIMAHEIGHIIGFRTELYDFDQDYSTSTSWDQFLTFPDGTQQPGYFNGPEAMSVYGGPVPITGYYNATHPNGIGSIMDPTFSQGGVRFVGVLDKAMMHDIGVMV